MTARAFSRSVGTAAAIIGAAMLMYVGYVMWPVVTYRSAYSSDVVPGPEVRSALPPPEPVRLVEGESLGELRIERLGLTSPIAEGESDAVLRGGIGHLADTPWIGQAGNVALAGHRDTVFRPLRDIRIGDVIDVQTSERRIRYAVQSTRVVAPDRLDVLDSSPGANTLTLITCFPFAFIGAAPERFVVRAIEIRD